MTPDDDITSGFDTYFLPISFCSPFFLFLFFKRVSIDWKNIFIIFFFIVWWLSEEVGFSYGVASWNKFLIAKWRFVEFFQSYIYI